MNSHLNNHLIILMRCSLFVLVVLQLPFKAAAGETSFGFAVAHGEESSQAYDLYVRHTFAPWHEGESLTLKPLVSGGVSLWERSDKSVWGANVNGGLLLEYSGGRTWRPYLAGTFGLAVISSENFNDLELGCHEQFRSRGSIGIKFGEKMQHNLQIDATHYSNGSMSGKNDGYNTIGAAFGIAF